MKLKELLKNLKLEGKTLSIIALDVDACLNCQDTKERYNGFIGIDLSKVALFHQILDSTNSYFVVSSTWRKDPDDLAHLLEKIDRNDKYLGATPILDKFTGVVFTSVSRGTEIREWFKLEEINPKEIKFVILDDQEDMEEFKPHLIQTDWSDGLTEEHVKRAIEQLK